MLRTDKLFDWYLERHREFWEPKKDRNEGWRASSLGYCPRRQTFERLGVPKAVEIDAKTRRAFAWGDQMHDFVKHVYQRCGLMVVNEAKVADPDRDITGHIDAIIREGWPEGVETIPQELTEKWSPEWMEFLVWLRASLAEQVEDPDVTRYVGLEIKSAHSRAMRRLLEEGAPYDHHEYQLGSYAIMAQVTDPVETDNGLGIVHNGVRVPLFDMKLVEDWRMVYVGKDSVGVLTFPLTGIAVERTLERIDLLNTAWSNGDLPDCTCEGTWEEKFCPYKQGRNCCVPPRQLEGGHDGG